MAKMPRLAQRPAGPWTKEKKEGMKMKIEKYKAYHGQRERQASGSTPQAKSLIKLYNRALTAAEMEQNYNAVKRRFGL